MQRLYSKSTGTTYFAGMHTGIPGDAVPIDEGLYMATIGNPESGKNRSHDAEGLPILIDPPPVVVTESDLCHAIDTASDAARQAVAGDPLRAEEYKSAAAEAKEFADSNYLGDVPQMVAAWAIGGRTPQQAAENILSEAAQYNGALVQLRTVRLAAKEQVRAAMAAGNTEQAQAIADAAVSAIQAAVAGIGNNA